MRQFKAWEVFAADSGPTRADAGHGEGTRFGRKPKADQAPGARDASHRLNARYAAEA
jgi:hypothetical protein